MNEGDPCRTISNSIVFYDRLGTSACFYNAVVVMEKVDEDKTGKEIGFEAG